MRSHYRYILFLALRFLRNPSVVRLLFGTSACSRLLRRTSNRHSSPVTGMLHVYVTKHAKTSTGNTRTVLSPIANLRELRDVDNLTILQRHRALTATMHY